LSYGQDSELIDQFILDLSDRGLRVLLHLVQPVEAAQAMPEPEALEAWGRFLERTLRRFEGKVEAVEIGTTINRAKWSGYRLKGFMALMEVSFRICRAHRVAVVAPNVTDFEPQYNAGILALLARRNLLPDVHSNNLFAERAIEPEDYDRKILGHRFASLHGFDLRKKMRLLAAIAAGHGLARNWSTCAFWTLPRIDRWLAWPEQQMADYLSRYYIICASVGSFERIYWGPLVSFREGLVDDGTFSRSDNDPNARDVVSYYDRMRGKSQDWRCRPAFDAMRTLCGQLTGATHLKDHAGSPASGLEAHAFSKMGRTIFALWTRNGHHARLRDCFSAADLAELESALDRDGKIFPEPPVFFGQSPIYLIWPVGYQPRFLASAGPVPHLVVARPESGYDYHEFDEANWRGLIRADSPEAAKRLAGKLSPDSIGQPSETGILRKARNAIWTVEHPLDPGRMLVVKKPIRMAWHKRILDRRKPSKARRSWNGTSELMRRGINTPEVVAYFESKTPGDLLNNWFICEHFESRLNVRGFFSQYADGTDAVEGIAFEAFAEQLVDFIFRMHTTGVYFRDLAGGNVLVDINDKHEIIFSLIDTARIRCQPFAISNRRRIADLKRLVLKLNAEQQVHFMNMYLGRLGTRFGLLDRIGFKLFAFKVHLKRIKRRWRKKLSR
ncbi:MAG TPA: lipopolysaccharide kinase InaA family protein, partial [Opitutales bacterium]|nr:lipopolysaccharide kinase InaA family protein [Opitutales bacterium]